MWFGRVEHEDDAGYVKRCMMMETDETRLRQRPRRFDEVVARQIWKVVASRERMQRFGTNREGKLEVKTSKPRFGVAWCVMVGSWTLDQVVMVFFIRQVTTLGKLFTPMCLSFNQGSIIWYRQKQGSKQAASAGVWLRALNRRSAPPFDDFTYSLFWDSGR